MRLDGIDAPESSQSCYQQADNAQSAWACGQASTEALRKLIGNQAVVCQVSTTDRYRRFIARFTVAGDGGRVDLGGAMVYHGWALAYTQYSRAYVGEQEQAQAQVTGRGIWSSHWQSPANYRRGNSR